MPTEVDELFQRGKILRINGLYDQAIPLLQQVIAADPTSAPAHMELGLAYCFTGLFDESIQELEAAAQLDAANLEIRLHLGKTYTMLGMFDEGASAFRDVLRLGSDGDQYHEEAKKQLAYFEST
ncbi:MAG: tetratricopeptide repeat protein [Armatimonadota bacterium]